MRDARHWILVAKDWAESDRPVVAAAVIAAMTLIALYLTDNI